MEKQRPITDKDMVRILSDMHAFGIMHLDKIRELLKEMDMQEGEDEQGERWKLANTLLNAAHAINQVIHPVNLLMLNNPSITDEDIKRKMTHYYALYESRASKFPKPCPCLVCESTVTNTDLEPDIVDEFPEIK